MTEQNREYDESLRVYTASVGDVQVDFEWSGFGHDAEQVPRQYYGWREREDGTREMVHWKGGQWVIDTALNTARAAPRTFGSRFRGRFK